MHELAVLRRIIDVCSERAAGARVLGVTVEIGSLTCLRPEALRGAYGPATEGTALAGSTLEVIRTPGQARCLACGRTVIVTALPPACPCGSVRLTRPEGGDALRIRSMEIEESD
jgi:hydrogenase nickel incorporation protein HypA/HybF